MNKVGHGGKFSPIRLAVEAILKQNGFSAGNQTPAKCIVFAMAADCGFEVSRQKQ